eukprot:356103_1
MAETSLQRALHSETEDDDYEMGSRVASESRLASLSHANPVVTNSKSPKEYSSGSLMSTVSVSSLKSLKSPSASAVSANEWNNNTDFHHHTAPSSPSPSKTLPSKQNVSFASHHDPPHADLDQIDFLRIWIQREKQERDTDEVRNVCRKLQKACMLREKW